MKLFLQTLPYNLRLLKPVNWVGVSTNQKHKISFVHEYTKKIV